MCKLAFRPPPGGLKKKSHVIKNIAAWTLKKKAIFAARCKDFNVPTHMEFYFQVQKIKGNIFED